MWIKQDIATKPCRHPAGGLKEQRFDICDLQSNILALCKMNQYHNTAPQNDKFYDQYDIDINYKPWKFMECQILRQSLLVDVTVWIFPCVQCTIFSR